VLDAKQSCGIIGRGNNLWGSAMDKLSMNDPLFAT
jgi:hypothetical protein